MGVCGMRELNRQGTQDFLKLAFDFIVVRGLLLQEILRMKIDGFQLHLLVRSSMHI